MLITNVVLDYVRLTHCESIFGLVSKFDSLTTIGGLEASRQGYDIAPAAHVGLFDGALRIAYGTALRAGQSRRFWAVGFSFMGLTEQGAKLVSNLSK